LCGGIDALRDFLLKNPERDPDDLHDALLVATRKGTFPIFQLMLDCAGASLKHSQALTAATYYGFEDRFDRLLPRSNPQDHERMALKVAAELGHLHLVKKLVPVSTAEQCNSAFLCAARAGKVNITKYLLPFAGPSLYPRVLFEASEINCVEIIDLILPHYTFHPDHLLFARGCFKEAARQGHLDSVRRLLPFMDEEGIRGALYSSSFGGHRDAVDFLYPLVNARTVLGRMERDQCSPERTHLLRERLATEDTKKLLWDNLQTHYDESSGRPKNKM